MKQQIDGLRSGFLLVFVAASLMGCSLKTVHQDTAPSENSPSNDIPQVTDTAETPKVQAPAIGLLAHEDENADISEPVIKMAKNPKLPPAQEATFPVEPPKTGVPAEKALGWLKNGNQRFIKGFLRKDGQSLKDIQKLAAGAKPHSIIFTCSDSRMPPEIIFDQKLGEVDVIRVDGLTIDKSVLSSIEHAGDLGPHLLVVLGHNSCGAVKEAADQLSAQSDWIREKVASGELTVKTALYDLSHGKVDFAP